MQTANTWRLTERLQIELDQGNPFAAAVRATRMPMAITDPRLDDNPMVFVNDAFCALSGYEREELIGRNCRLLQGPDTDLLAVAQVRQAVRDRTDVDLDLLNYRKDGTPFWNALHINPVFSADGELHYFFASQYDVTARREALAAQTMLVHEVDHRVKNNLQIIAALLAMEAKAMPDPDGADRLRSTMGRIEALSIVHRRLYQSDDPTRFDVAEFVRDVVTNLVGRTRRRDLDVALALEPAFLPANLAGPLALIVNELVSDALRHAAPTGQGGRLAVEVASAEGSLRVRVTHDGVGHPMEAGEPGSFGRTLVSALSRQLGATTWGAAEAQGRSVVLEVPLGARTASEGTS